MIDVILLGVCLCFGWVLLALPVGYLVVKVLTALEVLEKREKENKNEKVKN